MSVSTSSKDRDRERLAELGYEQELKRGWSRLSNFGISFSIISVLTGCFSTFGQAWNNGGPVAITWGWLIISVFIMIIALSMAELVSSMPTSGGIYYWSAKLGGAAWGWFTGWLNLIGLIAVTASVDYGAAALTNVVLGLYKFDFILNFGDANHILGETFLLFGLILALHAAINIFSSHLVATLNAVSVGWQVLGVVVVIAVLALVPDHHQSVKFVLTERINNSGFGGGMYWFYVLPLGGLLTMYTITGYDASAHVSEETVGAEDHAPKGMWQSVFYSAIIGWLMLLSFEFAATNVPALNDAAGYAPSLFQEALGSGWAKLVLIAGVGANLFCGMSCVTSSSRMMYAFSRDRAVPGWKLWSRVDAKGTPTFAVIAVAVAALILTAPAMFGNAAGVPVAFFAVVSIAVIGLYVAYSIPIFLRWRAGSAFVTGPWTVGAHYKWMGPVACAWVALCAVVFCLPLSPAGVPWRDGFDWNAVNYAPLVVGGVLAIVGLWWLVSARKTFTGPIRTVKTEPASSAPIGLDTPLVPGAVAAPAQA